MTSESEKSSKWYVDYLKSAKVQIKAITAEICSFFKSWIPYIRRQPLMMLISSVTFHDGHGLPRPGPFLKTRFQSRVLSIYIPCIQAGPKN
jgi:hypothetical protein